MGKDRPERIVLRIQRLYGAITILALLGTLSELFGRSGFRDVLEDFLSLLMFGTTYFGLRLRRDWVIPLALISSAFQCLRFFLTIMYPAGDAQALALKLAACLALLFFAYQLSFFCRTDVRTLFEHRGHVVF